MGPLLSPAFETFADVCDANLRTQYGLILRLWDRDRKQIIGHRAEGSEALETLSGGR